jgi:hypothetical protein
VKVTRNDVLADIASLVEEYGPKHVDRNVSHRYMVDGKPTCLVGHVMARHDIRVPKMFNNRVFGDLAEQMKLRRKFDTEALAVLARVQRMQDSEWTWGAILTRIEER